MSDVPPLGIRDGGIGLCEFRLRVFLPSDGPEDAPVSVGYAKARLAPGQCGCVIRFPEDVTPEYVSDFLRSLSELAHPDKVAMLFEGWEKSRFETLRIPDEDDII